MCVSFIVNTHVVIVVVTGLQTVVTNLFISCRQVVIALLVPIVVVTSLEQAVDNL
jgi:hypothetical protein